MPATLIAVQNVSATGAILPPGTVFVADDASWPNLLATGQAATNAAQQTADAALFPITPTDAPNLGNA